MGAEDEEKLKAVADAQAIVEQDIPRSCRIPIEAANNIGWAIVTARIEPEDKETRDALLGKLEMVVPVDFYTQKDTVFRIENSGQEVQIDPTYGEVTFTGRTILGFNPERTLIFEPLRVAYQQAYLILHNAFVEAGGLDNASIRQGVERALDMN